MNLYLIYRCSVKHGFDGEVLGGGPWKHGVVGINNGVGGCMGLRVRKGAVRSGV